MGALTWLALSKTAVVGVSVTLFIPVFFIALAWLVNRPTREERERGER